jgi:hypothetical protein
LTSFALSANSALTGTPTAPTANSGTNNTQIATTAFVDNRVSGQDFSALVTKTGTETLTNKTLTSPTLTSPIFSGTPTAPTATSGANSTQVATTAFVESRVSGIDLSTLATLSSPTLTGTPLAPTASAGTDTTQIATTAFVNTALSSGAANVTIGLTAPSSPTIGDLWFDSANLQPYIYYNDGNSQQWVSFAIGGRGQHKAKIDIQASAPSSPDTGDLWWDPTNLQPYIYYNDGNSQQWVSFAIGGRSGGTEFSVSETAPSSPEDGDLWLDAENLKTFVYYNDGNSSQWVRLTQVL